MTSLKFVDLDCTDNTLKGLPDGREMFNLEYKDESFINKFDMPYLKEVAEKEEKRLKILN